MDRHLLLLVRSTTSLDSHEESEGINSNPTMRPVGSCIWER